MPNTDIIREARELCERATPGPWSVDTNEPFSSGVTGAFADAKGKYVFFHDPYEDNAVSIQDAEFIARSHTLIPELLDLLAAKDAEIARLTRENEQLAINGGKYIKIAEERYEMFERAVTRAEKVEAERDAAIDRLRGNCWACKRGRPYKAGSKTLTTCEHMACIASNRQRGCPHWEWRGG